jgi:DNA end-binding protein Ku
MIEELTCEWDPGKYKDEYRKRLKSIVDQKRKGKTIKAPKEAEQPDPVSDLMDALERSLASVRGS